MPTLNIQIKATSADASKYATTGKEHESLSKAIALLHGLQSGILSGAVTMAVSASDPVAASGTVTCASVADADTVTVGKIVLTAKTSPSGAAQWARGVSNTADAAALAACINAHTTLNKLVSATSSGAVVTITTNAKGTIGNQVGLSSSSGTTLAVTGSGYLTSGTGGAETVPVTLGR
jgi:phage tail sheath gpL-like